MKYRICTKISKTEQKCGEVYPAEKIKVPFSGSFVYSAGVSSVSTEEFMVFSDSDFQYAIENTRVIIPPERVIATFGPTTFHFILVSELMDRVNCIRIRKGRVEADRPQILSPHHLRQILLEGFSEEAKGFSSWLMQQGANLKFLRYGFHFRKTDLLEEIVHEPIGEVIKQLATRFQENRDPLYSLIEGVDDTWEVCVLKFTMDLIRQSAPDNVGEWRRRGLL